MIMTMAAELVDASSGSLMISDKSGRILRVVSALGMNPVLARSISTKKGKGIAGMVAASGTPLLVTDIEQDRCFGRPNRIRFSTKSCISLPLQFKETTIGVLNLADKKNGTPFIPSDQEILCTFLEQATIILGRSNALRKAKLNSITDPLTGLYNMRFLKKRFNEELSRSIRHNLNLTLIILSLDNISRQQGPRERGQTQMTVKKTARILTSSLRDIDLVGRSSEVEFCLILPATPKKEGAFVAERIIRAVTEGLAKDDDLSGGQSVHISAGIAFYPEDGASSADLIKVARNGISPRVTNLVGKSVPPTTNMTARTSSSVLTSA
jgi:diguanylate cyclase (GGDEF)-like protein